MSLLLVSQDVLIKACQNLGETGAAQSPAVCLEQLGMLRGCNSGWACRTFEWGYDPDGNSVVHVGKWGHTHLEGQLQAGL